MKNIFLFVMVLTFLCSCNKNAIVNPVDNTIDDKYLFALALEERSPEQIDYFIERIRMTENMQNIIKLFMKIEIDSLVKLDNQMNYIEQFTTQMNDVHKSILNKIAQWIYLKQIYQHEISPPVRILQRSELYLTPSHIDFELCPSENNACASEIRNKINALMTNDEIKVGLKNMASKDPCVNLSNQLKGYSFANNCLKKNKGQLRIQLLSLPFINKKLWLQALSSD